MVLHFNFGGNTIKGSLIFNMLSTQLNQCREAFYLFSINIAVLQSISTS